MDEAIGIQETFKQQGKTWSKNMQAALDTLFRLLATLDLLWLGINLTLKGSPLEEWVAKLIKKILFYGIGFWFLANGWDIANAIITSFGQLAGIATASTAVLQPSDVWAEAMDMVKKGINAIEGMSAWSAFGSIILLVIANIALLALCAYISAALLLAYCEAYIVMGAGSVVLGFLGCDWTKDYGRKYFTFALMTGIRLFTTLIICQLGFSIMSSTADAYGGAGTEINLEGILSGIGGLIVFAMLLTKIPNTLANMLAGGGIQGSENVAAGSSSIKSRITTPESKASSRQNAPAGYLASVSANPTLAIRTLAKLKSPILSFPTASMKSALEPTTIPPQTSSSLTHSPVMSD